MQENIWVAGVAGVLHRRTWGGGKSAWQSQASVPRNSGAAVPGPACPVGADPATKCVALIASVILAHAALGGSTPVATEA